MRRNFEGEVRLLVGPNRLSKTASGVDVRTLSRDELCRTLHTEMGISERLVASWVETGSLDSSLEPAPEIVPPPPAGVRPSQRAAV